MGARYHSLPAAAFLIVGTAVAGALARGSVDPACAGSPPGIRPEPEHARLRGAYGRLPLAFEASRGQTDPGVRFLARIGGGTLFLTSNEAVLALPSAPPGSGAGFPACAARQQVGEGKRGRRKRVVLRMRFVGANPAPEVVGLEQLPGKVNYFLGNDPKQWRANIPTYARVRYHQVYPGIDLVFYGRQQQLEYDFVLAPGADPDRIALAFQGAGGVEVDAHGDLVFHTAGGEVRQRKPRIYQEVNRIRRPVAGGYALLPEPRQPSLLGVQCSDRTRSPHLATPNFERPGLRTVGFQLAAYDRSRPLVIDPSFDYSTYLGGGGGDVGLGIAVDGAGSAYVTGSTDSADFPTANPFQGASGGGFSDAFVAKFNPPGTALVYSTYLGGADLDEAQAIAVDSSGSASVTGWTFSVDNPATPPNEGFPLANPLQPVFGGMVDAFLARLSPAGSALLYSTYLGGSGRENAFGKGDIALDAAGTAYVTGGTDSPNFPTTPGALDTTLNAADAFVARIDTSRAGAASLVYSTFLGGSGADEGTGIAVRGGAGGGAYVVGATTSNDFPVTVDAFQRSRAEDFAQDGFMAMLSRDGRRVSYGSYLGGNLYDRALDVAVGPRRRVYVTGSASSNQNFPTTAGAVWTGPGAFAMVLQTSGGRRRQRHRLIYSTLFPGYRDDEGRGIAAGPGGDAFVVGETRGDNFLSVDPIPGQGGLRGPSDAFVARINPAASGPASLVYSTYLGGDGSDAGFGIAVDRQNNAYVTGFTSSSDDPSTPGNEGFPVVNALQSTRRGGGDAFVARIAP